MRVRVGSVGEARRARYLAAVAFGLAHLSPTGPAMALYSLPRAVAAGAPRRS